MGVRGLLFAVGVFSLTAGTAWFGWENVGTNVAAGPVYGRELRDVETATKPLPAVPGRAYAILAIPAIGLRAPIVEGTDADALSKGVGHYQNTAALGQLGNVGLAGHRTTYGRPFWDLPRLRVGDVILLVTPTKTTTYHVTSMETVGPDRGDVLATSQPNVRELTLTTCTPMFTAARRYVVHARVL